MLEIVLQKLWNILIDGWSKLNLIISIRRFIKKKFKLLQLIFFFFSVPLNLRPVIYCTAIRKGNEKQWRFLWQRYFASNVGAEKSMIISALSCSREQWLLSRYLDWSLNSTLVRKQDASIVFAGVAREEVGFYLARNFFYDRIDDIYNTWVYKF